MKAKRKNTIAKGKRIQRLAREILEGEGWVVETARPLYVWVQGKPMAIQHDFFSCWDAICVNNYRVLFIQFTVDEMVSVKRKKIKDFPYPDCEIWGYKGGRNRHFRVYKKARDYEWVGDCKKV